ncbi:hypothetical protein OROHE_013929 [Orobanche hederae]
MASAKTVICFSLALFATAWADPCVMQGGTCPLLDTAAYNPFCSNSDDLNLCAHLANGARTWADAMTNTRQSVMNKVKAGKKIAYRVKSKLPADFTPQTKESIAATCRYAYDNVLYNIEQCIGFVKSDPYSLLDTYLSAATFTDCADGLQEFGVNLLEVADFDKEIIKLSSVLLAVTQLKSHEMR